MILKKLGNNNYLKNIKDKINKSYNNIFIIKTYKCESDFYINFYN